MGEVKFELPEELADAVRARASQSGQSVSVFIAELVRREIEPDVWSQAFLDAHRSWDGELEEPVDPVAEERDPL